MTAITPLLAVRARPIRTAPTSGLPELRGHREPPRRGSADRAAEPDDTDTSPPTGNHTDGVTVADLIAKVTGSAPHGSARRQARRSPNPSPNRRRTSAARPRQPRQLRPAQPRPDDPSDPDTEVIPAVSYAAEIPDLAALRRARAERVAPERVGEPSAEPSTRRRNPSHGAGSCWRGAPWPRSSRYSRWR